MKGKRKREEEEVREVKGKRKREEMEERERKENVKENNIFKVNIEKIFSEIEEFRVDNELSKLVKLPDINRYLFESTTLKVRRLNADIRC